MRTWFAGLRIGGRRLCGATLWAVVAQDNTLGPTWVMRVMIVPVSKIPWQKKKQKQMAAAAAIGTPPRF